jgi:hypothetical protein
VEYCVFQSGKRAFEHRAIQRVFVFEVVIEQRLVDPRLAGNGVGARPRNAILGKLLCRSLQNRRTAFFRLTARAHAAELMASLPQFALLLPDCVALFARLGAQLLTKASNFFPRWLPFHESL